jgi:hypothetical protein
MSQTTTRAPHSAIDELPAPHPVAVRDVPGVDDYTLRVTEPALRVVDAALAHQSPLNRHRTILVRKADDIRTAYAVYSLLNHPSATSGKLPLAPDDDLADLCIDCMLQGYVNRGLLKLADVPALNTALTSVARRATGFPQPAEAEAQLLTSQPRAGIRAAYALARDLAN